MQRSLAALALAAGVLLTTAGCGASTYRIVEKPATPLNAFPAVYIAPLRIEAWLENIPEGHRPKWRHVLKPAPELFGNEARAKLEGHLNVAPEPGEDTLIVESELLEFDPGSKGGRWIMGIFGVGEGKMTILCTLLDGADESPIGAAKAIGTVRMGWFGGSVYSMYERCGGGLGKFLVDHH